MQYATLAVNRVDGENGTVWTLADNDGPILSTRESQTAAVWRYFLNPANPPCTPLQFKIGWPKAEEDKLTDMLVVCRDGLIRRR